MSSCDPRAAGRDRCIKQTHTDSAVCFGEQSLYIFNRLASQLTDTTAAPCCLSVRLKRKKPTTLTNCCYFFIAFMSVWAVKIPDQCVYAQTHTLSLSVSLVFHFFMPACVNICCRLVHLLLQHSRKASTCSMVKFSPLFNAVSVSAVVALPVLPPAGWIYF